MFALLYICTIQNFASFRLFIARSARLFHLAHRGTFFTPVGGGKSSLKKSCNLLTPAFRCSSTCWVIARFRSYKFSVWHVQLKLGDDNIVREYFKLCWNLSTSLFCSIILYLYPLFTCILCPNALSMLFLSSANWFPHFMSDWVMGSALSPIWNWINHLVFIFVDLKSNCFVLLLR